MKKTWSKMNAFVLTFCITLCLWTAAADKVIEVTYNLLEEQPLQTLVGDVVQDAKLGQVFARDVLPTLSYEFLKESKLCRNCFSISKTTGKLFIESRLDRDVLCPGADQCEIVLNVRVSPVRYFKIIQVTMNILDRNDNPPQFPQAAATVTISEASPVGARFSLPSAHDQDSPKFGIARYRLVPASPQFDVVRSDSAAGTEEVMLVVKRKLDREALSTYNLMVSCEDKGSPSKAGTMEITVKISDYNDHRPLFENATYQVSVEENQLAPTYITRVTAHDRDEGGNADISYSFDIVTKNRFGNLFSIEAKTGKIYAKQSLDAEDQKEYILTVVASDGGQVALIGQAKVRVLVSDLNDNPPQITINDVEGTHNTIRIPETANSEQAVGHITITDADTGRNGEFHCVLDNHMFKLEHMIQDEYRLSAVSGLDRESAANYTVTVRCRDNGTPTREGRATVKVDLTDINDNAPKFSKKVYELSIRENMRKGSSVMRLTAQDADIGLNGEVLYWLGAGAKDMLTIHPTSGVIRTNMVFDYETDSNFEFHVIARDKGGVPMSSSCLVRVTLVDENDQKPRFTQSHYSFRIPENMAGRIGIGSVSAQDTDSSAYNAFTLHLETDDTGTFTMDRINGTIYTEKPLDREIQAVHQLKVVARDNSSPFWRTETRITVTVTDENDNTPVIDFPNATHQTVSLSSKTKVGSRLCNVLAHDRDEGLNAQLTYSMISSAEVPFSVHPLTGVVYLQSQVTGDSIFNVVIEVTDKGIPRQSSQTPLTVTFNASIPLAVGNQGGRNGTLDSRGAGDGASAVSNLVLIVALSAIFTLIILALAVLLVVLRCSRRKSARASTDVNYNMSRDFPDGKEHPRPFTVMTGVRDGPVGSSSQQPSQSTVEERTPDRPPRKRKINSYHEVQHWLQSHPDDNLDAASHTSEQLSNSDSGRGTEEGEGGTNPGSRDTSTEEAIPGNPNITMSGRSKGKKVSFSDPVTSCEKMKKSCDQTCVNSGQSQSFIMLENAWQHLQNQNHKTAEFQRYPNMTLIEKPNTHPGQAPGSCLIPNHVTGVKYYGQETCSPFGDGMTSWYLTRGLSADQLDETCSDDGSTTTSGSYVMGVDDLTSATVV